MSSFGLSPDKTWVKQGFFVALGVLAALVLVGLLTGIVGK